MRLAFVMLEDLCVTSSRLPIIASFLENHLLQIPERLRTACVCLVWRVKLRSLRCKKTNGTGKTTTLETIAGLNHPISGTVELSGEKVGGTPAYQLAGRGLALVPEGRALFPGLTVREHLRLAGGRGGPGGRCGRGGPGGRCGRGGQSRRASTREDELLEILPELHKCLGRKAGLLSGGEQQMLAVGRALVTRPRLLLVDEMSLGLAPVIVERLIPVLRRAADELGSSVLFVEQHVALALEVADRAYVLTHGRIGLEGPAAELRERRELLAASYLGETAA